MHSISEFEPSDPGTDERIWNAALAALPEWKPKSGTLLIVSPHPDDEVLGCGGLIRRWVLSGRDVIVVSITDGERAYPGWKDLGTARRRELQSALRLLSPRPIPLIRLGVPDGAVARHRRRLEEYIVHLVRPDMTIVAPFEHDGHPDHDAAGETCCKLGRECNVSVVRYPIWTWHHSTPPALLGWNCRRFSLDPETQSVKASAAGCFVSQLRPPGRLPIIPAHVLAHFARPYEVFMV